MADRKQPCCTPEPRGAAAGRHPIRGPGWDEPALPTASRPWIRISAGSFLMGCDRQEGYATDGEGPARVVGLDAYAISATPVTNAEFAEFVGATGYTTQAERLGYSFVFRPPAPGAARQSIALMSWWDEQPRVSWRNPDGPESSVETLHDHPVVHVSWADATAYATWAGGRLPTEAEWECAARGGLTGARYPWGDELTPGGEWLCNIWQGDFPTHNSCEDGYSTTSPVRTYPANGYGLYDVSGNVWEWCHDWFTAPAPAQEGPMLVNPAGPPTGTRRVTRGGSFLCHDSYCNRYRVAARSSSAPAATAANLGFRLARSVHPRSGA